MSLTAKTMAWKKLGELLSQDSRDQCEDARSLYDLLKDAGEQYQALERALLGDD